MNFKKKNCFLKKLTESQFNITRRVRTNTFYALNLLALQRELKLLIRLLRHAQKTSAQLLLKPGSNNDCEEIFKELIDNLDVQIEILSKRNTALAKINELKKKEPARTIFLFENYNSQTYKGLQKNYPHNTVVSFTKYISKLSNTYNINNDFLDVKKLIFILVLIDKMLKI